MDLKKKILVWLNTVVGLK